VPGAAIVICAGLHFLFLPTRWTSTIFAPGAEIQGRTLTDFVVAAADEAACRAIQETEIIRLSIEGQRQIAAAILDPPGPTLALKRAARRYRQLSGMA
jgi:uncharacterized protein (DUF1778 family)